jgi:hypothetical protein
MELSIWISRRRVCFEIWHSWRSTKGRIYSEERSELRRCPLKRSAQRGFTEFLRQPPRPPASLTTPNLEDARGRVNRRRGAPGSEELAEPIRRRKKSGTPGPIWDLGLVEGRRADPLV